MDIDDEKRNSAAGIATTAALGGTKAKGVGGRQTYPPADPQGGGYLDNCSTSNFQKKTDPRFKELEQLGLQPVWLRVAEVTGVDVFLEIWRILSQEPHHATDGGRLLVPMRSYRNYLRFQRNRYIETLRNMGMSPRAIRRRVADQLGEQICLRQIERLSGAQTKAIRQVGQ